MLCRFYSKGGVTATTSLSAKPWRCRWGSPQLLRCVGASAPCAVPNYASTPSQVAAVGSASTASSLHTSTRFFRCSGVLCTPSRTVPSSPSHRSPRHSSQHRRGSRRGSAKAPSWHAAASGPKSSSRSRRHQGAARAADEVPMTDSEDGSEVPAQRSGGEVDDGLRKSAVCSTSGPRDGRFGPELIADREGAQSAHSSSLPDTAQEVGQLSSEPGWGFETVDAATGKTSLEELYDRNLSRIHAVLERPLPPMPQDGSVDPDFFVGFAAYSYQLRDQYRAVIARELQVPVKAVRLSVAWSGRFNVKRFGRVQKVCGVCLDRTVIAHMGEYSMEGKDTHSADAHDSTEQKQDAKRTSASGDLPDALQQRIAAFISAINTHKREDLLQVQFFQASPPIPEVEFALTRQEHRLVYHLHEWIRRHVLQPTVAVVVYGVPPSQLPTADSLKEGKTSTDTAAVEDVVHRYYVRWQLKAIEESAAQHREVQNRWLRLLHRREVVPAVMSLTELATTLAVAVVGGDVSGVKVHKMADEADTNPIEHRHAEAVLLSGPVRDLLMDVAAVAVAPVAASSTADSEEKGVTDVDTPAGGVAAEGAGKTLQRVCVRKDVLLPQQRSSRGTAPSTPALDLSAAAQREAALRWVRLVFQALLLNEAHSEQAGTGTDGATPDSTSTSTVAAEVRLPALFAQGVYAGSRDEVAYLQHNRTAMDALLLHPHEISFKRKFVSRLRNGHRRPRMEEEAAALHPSSG